MVNTEAKVIIYSLLFGIPFLFLALFLSNILTSILPRNIIGSILYLVIGLGFSFAYMVFFTVAIFLIEIGVDE